MPTVADAVNAASDRDPLLQGLSVLSQYESIPFTQYIRYVLPLDGYVFWLKTQQTMIQGSLHVANNKRQLEDETISVNRVIFTTGELIQEFNALEPDAIWIGEVKGLKFAFSQAGPFYRNAGLFHYAGDAVNPAVQTQLVDVGSQLPLNTLIVSNSLPAWLTLRHYAPAWLLAGNPAITLYPSFLVPDNLQAPYGSVHIAPEATQPINLAPLIGQYSQHSQLTSDRVRITLYGATNAQAQAFLDLVNQYSLDTDTIGIMEPGIVRDEKRTQVEISVLAMKKTIEFQVSYLQNAMPNVAQALIRSVPVNVIVTEPIFSVPVSVLPQ